MLSDNKLLSLFNWRSAVKQAITPRYFYGIFNFRRRRPLSPICSSSISPHQRQHKFTSERLIYSDNRFNSHGKVQKFGHHRNVDGRRWHGTKSRLRQRRRETGRGYHWESTLLLCVPEATNSRATRASLGNSDVCLCCGFLQTSVARDHSNDDNDWPANSSIHLM